MERQPGHAPADLQSLNGGSEGITVSEWLFYIIIYSLYYPLFLCICLFIDLSIFFFKFQQFVSAPQLQMPRPGSLSPYWDKNRPRSITPEPWGDIPIVSRPYLANYPDSDLQNRGTLGPSQAVIDTVTLDESGDEIHIRDGHENQVSRVQKITSTSS